MPWQIKIKNHQSGETVEHSFEQGTVHIGRDPNSDVMLDYHRVSRRHVELRSNEMGSVTVVDSSRNGTSVRRHGEWVPVEEATKLAPPFVLRVAHWTVKVEQAPQPEVVEEEEPAWDQSVMLPASMVGKNAEGILVFDLCESSLIANKDDHMAYHLKQRLTQIAEPILEQFGRRFFKSTGDGFLATFTEVENALQAAIMIEDRIHYRNERTSHEQIHYRIALHFGDVWTIASGGDDVHGNDVNITFRIEGVQAPAFPEIKALFPKQNRILCSDRFQEEIGDLAEKYASDCVPCGAADLKGIVDPVEIFWVKTKYSNEDLDSTQAVSRV